MRYASMCVHSAGTTAFMLALTLLLPRTAAPQQDRWPDPSTTAAPLRPDLEVPAVCREGEPPTLDPPYRAGFITPSTTVADVHANCQEVVHGWDWAEGEPYPVLGIKVGGVSFLLRAEGTQADDRIYAVQTGSPRAVTSRGIAAGGGSTFGDVHAMDPDARFISSFECDGGYGMRSDRGGSSVAYWTSVDDFPLDPGAPTFPFPLCGTAAYDTVLADIPVRTIEFRLVDTTKSEPAVSEADAELREAEQAWRSAEETWEGFRRETRRLRTEMASLPRGSAEYRETSERLHQFEDALERAEAHSDAMYIEYMRLKEQHEAEADASEQSAASVESERSNPSDTPAEPARDAQRPRLVTTNAEYQRLVRDVYPEAFLAAGIGGTANVWMLVDETGTVTRTRIEESSGYAAIDEAALEVARQLEFAPATVDDRKVEVWVAYDLTLEVNRR